MNAASSYFRQKIGDYFEEALKFCPNPRSICNWITIELPVD